MLQLIRQCQAGRGTSVMNIMSHMITSQIERLTLIVGTDWTVLWHFSPWQRRISKLRRRWIFILGNTGLEVCVVVCVVSVLSRLFQHSQIQESNVLSFRLFMRPSTVHVHPASMLIIIIIVTKWIKSCLLPCFGTFKMPILMFISILVFRPKGQI